MIKRLMVIAALLSLALLISSCSAGAGKSTPTPVATPVAIQKPTYQVQRGTVLNMLRLQGRVAPLNQQDLFFRSDGYVRTVDFSGGDQVRAGDVLAELELGDLEIQLSQAQLALQQSETELAQAEQDNANQLIEAQLELDKANILAQQAGALGINPSIDAAQAVVDNAANVLRAAQQKYQKAQENPYSSNTELEDDRKKVEQAKWDLEIAQKKLESAKAQKDFDQNLVRVQETLQAALQEYHSSVNNPDLTVEEREAIWQQLGQAKEDYENTWMEYADIVAGPTYLPADAQVLAKDLALRRLRVED